MEEQIEQLLQGVRGILGRDLAGAYLHGSAVLDGLRPRSDLDFIAVTRRRTTPEEKRRLVDVLLELSGRVGSIGPPRPVEFDLLVESEIRPWRHPAPCDFHYDESIPEEFEKGNLEPWSSEINRDLAALITMARGANASLFGPPPAEMFDPIPRADYHDAILKDIEEADMVGHLLRVDTRNFVLTLPRIWAGLETDQLYSKDSAAAWALARLPEEHRPVLERARAIYLGEAKEYWDDLRPQVEAYGAYLVSEIERAKSSMALRLSR